MNNRIIVHLGAHRTGTTLFQNYLYENRMQALKHGFELVGIDQTRAGMMDGLFRRVDDNSPDALKRAEASAKDLRSLLFDALAKDRKVLLSEENLIGTMEENLRECSVYPNVALRLERFQEPFSLASRFFITIRELSDWWVSSIFFLTMRGLAYPSQTQIERIASSSRGWRHVVQDIRRVFPDTPITIREFRFKTDNPKQQLLRVSGWKYFNETKKFTERSNARKTVEEVKRELVERGEFRAAKQLTSGELMIPFNYRQRDQLLDTYDNDLSWITQNLRPRDKFLSAQEISVRSVPKVAEEN